MLKVVPIVAMGVGAYAVEELRPRQILYAATAVVLVEHSDDLAPYLNLAAPHAPVQASRNGRILHITGTNSDPNAAIAQADAAAQSVVDRAGKLQPAHPRTTAPEFADNVEFAAFPEEAALPNPPHRGVLRGASTAREVFPADSRLRIVAGAGVIGLTVRAGWVFIYQVKLRRFRSLE